MGRLLAGILVALVVAGAASSRTPRVTTVLGVRGPIDALALDGTRIAWVNGGAPCPRFLHTLDARTRRVAPVPIAPKRCNQFDGWNVHDPMALAGARVLYAWDQWSNSENDVDLYAVDTRSGRVGRAGGLATYGGHDEGDPYVPFPIDGAGSQLLFGDISAYDFMLYDRTVDRVGAGHTASLASTYG